MDIAPEEETDPNACKWAVNLARLLIVVCILFWTMYLLFDEFVPHAASTMVEAFTSDQQENNLLIEDTGEIVIEINSPEKIVCSISSR